MALYNENAQNYLEPVSKLLDIEKAKAEEVKKAIEKIEFSIKKMKVEKNDTVKMHQIRTMYSLLKQGKNENKLYEIMPRLKYIGARQKGNSGKFIVKLLELLINKIHESGESDKGKMIKGLLYIMECILAYHKFHIYKD